MDTKTFLEPAAVSSTAFLKHGALLVSSVVSQERIGLLREAFFDRSERYLRDTVHADALNVGDRRLMVTLDFEPPFSEVDVFAPSCVLPTLRTLLSGDCVLGSFGAVVSLPGASAQHIHRDAPELFPGSPIEPMLPPYAITLIVPLIDVDETTGTTVVWPGSHRDRRAQSDHLPDGARWAKMRAGDMLLMDYRLVHMGSANHSSAPRPVLYFVYCRPWFRDCVNYRKQPRLKVTEDGLTSIPIEYRGLIST